MESYFVFSGQVQSPLSFHFLYFQYRNDKSGLYSMLGHQINQTQFSKTIDFEPG